LLALSVIAAWLVARVMVRRLERLVAAADRVTNGDVSPAPLLPGPPDEVGRLTVAFNVMLEQICTEQQRLEKLVAVRTAELSASKEQFRQIAETTRAIPFEIDLLQQRFTYLGPQAVELLGYDLAELQKPNVLEKLMEPKAFQEMQRDLAAQLARAPRYDHELTLRAKDGRLVHLRSSANVAHGTIARGMVLDVTERKALELELEQSHRLESMGRLASGLAHEINTPVQYANDSVTFVRDAWTEVMALLDEYRKIQVLEEREAAADLEFLRENVPRSTERAIEGLARIADIVRSMKAFAQAEDTGLAAYDLKAGLETTLVVMRNQYKYVADVETVFDDVPHVLGRPGELNQVWLALLENAAQAVSDTGKRGVITVRTALDAGRVVVSIGDTGGGIPNSVVPHVFEQFFTTRTIGKGRGQNLAAARAVVKRYGGDIWFSTEVGAGTTFYVALPSPDAEPSSQAA
jgi:PAS domain S-box-containing protein